MTNNYEKYGLAVAACLTLEVNTALTFTRGPTHSLINDPPYTNIFYLKRGGSFGDLEGGPTPLRTIE